jgi:hypothetical protein
MAGASHKPQRSLFSLGAAKSAATPVEPVEAEIDDLPSRNLKAIAAAVMQGAAGALTPAAPLIELRGPASRPPVLADIASPWFAYWARELECDVRAERKLWEAVSVLQAFYEAGVLRPGARVLGFGVGDEALPSYLASIGLEVVATDMSGVTDPDHCWKPSFLDRDRFDALVEVSDVDIRRLDDKTLRGFDACWSCGVLDALADHEQATDAAILTMDTLKPGGVAVHVTEYAFANDQPESHSGALCFPRVFFEKLAEKLDGRGHRTAPLGFGLGDQPLDGYVDTEPFGDGMVAGVSAPHLKIRIGGELRTSFALTVTARG